MHVAFNMTRVTAIAPYVKNDGSVSHYPRAFRDWLYAESPTLSWTEYNTNGVWALNAREPGVLFEFYVEHGQAVDFAHRIGDALRVLMPDQVAIQVTYEPTPLRVLEF